MILIFISCILISLITVTAGGGMAFFQRPVAVPYLTLSLVWWSLAMLRKRGAPSNYDRKQRIMVAALGAIAVPLLIFASPWEYAHFAGPIPRDGLSAWAGLALLVVGIALQAVAMWTLHDFYTVRMGIQPAQHLVMSGPYHLVRHPGYLSYLLSMLGIGLALSSLIALGLFALVIPFLLVRIRREEEMLVAEFGEEYRIYMRRTRRLIPWIF